MPEAINIPWTYEELRIVALKFKARNEFKFGSNEAYCALQKRGLLDELCSHMPKQWSSEELQEKALKYPTRI